MTSERQETENRDEFGYSESDIVKHHGNPVWEAIWSTIKRWDISRKNDGLYSSATGTDVQVIFDAVAAALRATPRAVPDETREAEVFTASAGTCRRCGSRVRMGGPAPDSCTNCAAPAESHPPCAGEVREVYALAEKMPHWFACRALLRDNDPDKRDGRCDCDRGKLLDALTAALGRPS